MQWIRRPSTPSRRRRPRARVLPALLAASALLATAGTSSASFTFTDLVAERNTATEGLGDSERFAYGGDRINRFNGALALTLPIGGTYPVGGNLTYGLALHYSSNLWRLDAGTSVTATLDSHFNAGAGWSLSRGALYAPSSADNPTPHWVFRSPEGRTSRFHNTLLDGHAPVANTFYTRDGSYLRLKINGSTAVVGLAAGIEKQFLQQPDGSWRFDEERDLHGNWLRATYLPSSIVLSDSAGRLQTLVLQADPAGSGGMVIDRVELTAFGGATAEWKLYYSTQTVDLPSQDTDPATPAQRTIAVLTTVERPDGSQSTFDYFGVGQGSAPASGRLKTHDLLTGGQVGYTYQIVELPKVNGALHTADVLGVATRTARTVSGNGKPSNVGQWTLTMTLDRDRDTLTNDKPRELTTRITYPDGHYRDTKHSAYAGGNPANDTTPSTNFFLRDYGFPFTKNGTVAGNPNYLTEEIYTSTGTLLRSIAVRYQWGTCSGCWDQHPRRNGGVTTYQDGSGLIEATSELFDNFGRQTLAISYDNAGEVPTRTTTRVFPHGMPAAGSNWVLTGWGQETVQEASETEVRQRCLDASTGQVTRERTLAGAAPAAHDILRVHSYHATGDRATTQFYGADVQSVATGALCTLTLPLDDQLAQFWNTQDGVVVAEGWSNANGSVFLQTRSALVDTNTGLVASASGADGFTWTYTYDFLGRPLTAVPQAGHGGGTFTSYVAAGANNGLTTTVRVEGSDGTELSKVETVLDPFGRVSKRREWSDGGWRIDRQTYDAQSRRLVRTDAAGDQTRWLDYDPFHRPATIRPPEGTVHDRTYTYQGRAETETSKIGKEWNDITNSVIEIARSVTRRDDRFGRQLEEHIVDADGEFRTTTVTRGLDGDIRNTVVTDGIRTETTATPDRTDNRGFVIETPAGDPITGYDVLGHRTEVDFGEGPVAQIFDRAGRLFEQRSDSVSGDLWVRNTYATASAGNDYRGGKLLSSLRVNRNVPHLPSSEVHVTDTFAYTGDQGSLAERRTTIVSGSQTVFELVSSQGVDVSGEVSSLTFPDCDPAANDTFTLCSPRPARVMETERSYGELVRFSASVGGTHEAWIDSFTRDSAGRVTQMQLGNGIVEDRDYSSANGRLERLTLTSPTTGVFYDSGLAEYDGQGKLVKLGTQRHISEDAYRLALSAPPVPGNPGHVIPDNDPKDRLGLHTQRDYKVPYRWDPASGQQEQVIEAYVYGPGNRMVWNRRFNDYQAANYRNSEDLWYLTDPSGRTVREVNALTYYAGTNPQWSNAQADAVWMQVGNSQDSIFLGGERLGETTDSANAPSRTFFHSDFLGGRLAESSPDGTAEAVTAPLF